jgi:hypothetical protein
VMMHQLVPSSTSSTSSTRAPSATTDIAVRLVGAPVHTARLQCGRRGCGAVVGAAQHGLGPRALRHGAGHHGQHVAHPRVAPQPVRRVQLVAAPPRRQQKTLRAAPPAPHQPPRRSCVMQARRECVTCIRHALARSRGGCHRRIAWSRRGRCAAGNTAVFVCLAAGRTLHTLRANGCGVLASGQASGEQGGWRVGDARAAGPTGARRSRPAGRCACDGAARRPAPTRPRPRRPRCAAASPSRTHAPVLPARCLTLSSCTGAGLCAALPAGGEMGGERGMGVCDAAVQRGNWSPSIVVSRLG